MFIPSYEVHLYSNLTYLSSTSFIENGGAISVFAENDAELAMASFANLPGGKFTFEGRGTAKISTGIRFVNAFTSTFEVDIAQDLMFNVFNVGNQNYDFENSGTFVLKSGNLLTYNSLKHLMNSGYYGLRCNNEGRFLFRNILNIAELHIQASSFTDFLSFHDLINDGSFSFTWGLCQGTVVCAHGSIHNSRMIRIEGLGGQGQILHNGPIHNNGLIHLRHSCITQSADVTGMGCWSLMDSSCIAINANFLFESAQTIILLDRSAYIVIQEMFGQAVIHKLDGVLNAATIIRSKVTLSDVFYEPPTGFLTVVSDVNKFMVFYIGEGYNAEGFMFKDNEVSYVGIVPPPRPIPAVCQPDELLGLGRNKIAKQR